MRKRIAVLLLAMMIVMSNINVYAASSEGEFGDVSKIPPAVSEMSETEIVETAELEAEVPETTESETEVIETAEPETTEPETTEPETTEPETTEPETETPAKTVPQETAPEGSVIEDELAAEEAELLTVPMASITSAQNVEEGITLKWKAVEGTEKYYVYMRESDGSLKLLDSTEECTCTVQNLTGDTMYVFHVFCRELTEDELASPSADAMRIISRALQAVEGEGSLTFGGVNVQLGGYKGIACRFIETPRISQVSIVKKEVTLTWNAVTGAEKYRVYYRTQTGSWLKCGDTEDTTIKVTNLKVNRCYYFTVRCISADGTKLASGRHDETTLYAVGVGHVPYTGVDYTKQTTDKNRLQALKTAEDMCTATWTAPCDFTSWFNDDRTYSHTFALDGTVAQKYVGGKTYTGIPYSMYDHTYNLSKWTDYFLNSFDKSAMEGRYYGRPQPGTTKGIDCSSYVYQCLLTCDDNHGVPMLSTYSMVRSGYYVKEDWTQLEPGDVILKQGHVLMYAGKTADGKCATFESCASTSGVRYNEVPLSEYVRDNYKPYRFKYYSTSKNLAYSTLDAPAVTLSTQDTKLVLSWDNVGAAKFRVEVRKNGGSWTTQTTTTGTSATVVAENGVKYEFRVCGLNSSGNVVSKYSEVKTKFFLTSVSLSSLSNYAAGKVKVVWGTNAKADGYEIQYTTKSLFTSKAKKATVKGASTAVKYLSSMEKDKTYIIRIRAYKESGGKTYYSAWSARKSIAITK